MKCATSLEILAEDITSGTNVEKILWKRDGWIRTTETMFVFITYCIYGAVLVDLIVDVIVPS